MKFSVQGQKLICTDYSLQVEETKGYYVAEFTFSNEWDEMTHIEAFFSANGYTDRRAVIDGICEVPALVLAHPTYYEIALHGYKGRTNYPTIICGMPAVQETISDAFFRTQFNEDVVGEVMEAIADYKEDTDQQIDEFKQEVNEQVTELAGRVTTAEQTVSGMEETVEQHTEDITDLKGRMETAEGDIVSHDDRLDTAEGDIDNLETAVGQIPNTEVVKDLSVQTTGTASTIVKEKVNVKTGATSQAQTSMPIADTDKVGLMTPEQVQAIADLQDEVGGLLNQNIRLLYTTKDNPTESEIEQFVIDAGYTDTTKWASISVLVKATNHIWRYYANTEEWTDLGLDTVQQASVDNLGIVKGSTADGKIAVESDGTMSLNGYDTLVDDVANAKDDIDNLQTDIESAQNNIDNLQTNSATKVTGATFGNFASLNNNGDIADSGKKASDFMASGSAYTKAEADELLDDKANVLTTYTKLEVDGLITGAKPRKVSVTLGTTWTGSNPYLQAINIPNAQSTDVVSVVIDKTLQDQMQLDTVTNCYVKYITDGFYFVCVGAGFTDTITLELIVEAGA